MPELFAKLVAILAVFAVVATLRRAEQVEMTLKNCSYCQEVTKSLLEVELTRGLISDASYDQICGKCRISY